MRGRRNRVKHPRTIAERQAFLSRRKLPARIRSVVACIIPKTLRPHVDFAIRLRTLEEQRRLFGDSPASPNSPHTEGRAMDLDIDKHYEESPWLKAQRSVEMAINVQNAMERFMEKHPPGPEHYLQNYLKEGDKKP